MNLSLVSLVLAASLVQGPSSGPPPAELASTATNDFIEKIYPMNYVSGNVSHLMYEKSVHVNYELKLDGPVERSLDSRSLVARVAYRPTAAALLSNTLVAVAGKRDTRTIIEIWELRAPPPIESVVGSPASSFAGGPVGEPSVFQRTVVFDRAEAGKDTVRALFGNRGRANSLFVQFFDSGDIYELDYSEAITPSTPPPQTPFPLTMVLSATAGGSTPSAPEVASLDLRWVQSRHHEIEGYCYVLSVPFEVQWNATTVTPAVWLFDHDLDGAIDEWAALTPSEEGARELGGMEYYVDRGRQTRWGE